MERVIHRQPPARFWLRAALLTGAICALPWLVLQRFSIGFDPQTDQCLPGARLFVVDEWHRAPERGQAFAFRAHGLNPWFRDGTKMIKVVDGLPGDRVAISERGVAINDHLVVEGLPLAARLRKDPAAFARTFVLAPDEYLLLGRTPASFDGRYWGTVRRDALLGRAYQPWRDWK